MQGRLLQQYLQRRKEGGRISPAASKGTAKAAVEEHVKELLGVHLALRGEGPPGALVPAREPRRLRAVPIVRGALVRIALRHEKARDTAARMRQLRPIQAAAVCVPASVGDACGRACL